MSNKTINYILLTGLFVPVILLFWPFAEWNGTASLILRIIPAISVQQLVCRTTKKNLSGLHLLLFLQRQLCGELIYISHQNTG